MPDSSTALKAYRNKKLGYRLWREGYVRHIHVKPNVQANNKLFVRSFFLRLFPLKKA